MRQLALALAVVCLAPAAARAAKCPLVMIVLDRSGSMDAGADGNYSTKPSKMEIAKQAITQLVTTYGKRLPLGFTTFQQGACSVGNKDGVDILVEPKKGTAQQILQQVAAVTTAGSTNTGLAVKKVADLPAMHGPDRPEYSYIILITDGEPNCSGDPQFTIDNTKYAFETKKVKTFVVGFGALPDAAKMNMEQVASVGGAPCTGATCNGRSWYAAENAQSLEAALDAISQQIAGEFGTICDDSCYSNGCPSAGEICVSGECKTDPCANVTTCAPGDYCYTDGESPGTCVRACPNPCPVGEICSTNGTCVVDPCANAPACPAGKVCRAGQCVADKCTEGCDPGLFCYQGECVHNACGHVRCPDGYDCVGPLGACVARTNVGGGVGSGGGGPGGGNSGRGRGGGGCAFVPGDLGAPALFAFGLVALALALRARRLRR